ncbi:saccharopine dehydrogenase NADP-binding domain-containing protein [Paenibacillus thermoaerophilus]|uniref:Saccharopine dehydrogenase NADP-binding domain-containing protein n=1 Tax=Paenibacillus thermoaerophilus TaxID=1215385 RepID=A0ABW2UY80_9BACL|nr:saccharopine dehydrogenase NADP-binding domain-containing protein [Paenibacillus thermoaerophilus]
MSASQLVITLLGSAGGVARAVLAVLDHASGTPDDPLHDKLSGSKLYLLDREARPKSYYARLLSRYPGKFGVLTLDLENRDQLLHHLRSSGTTLVIDCSWADTLGTMACCHETGAAYVNTALECFEADDDASVARYSLLRRYDLFEQRRGSFPGLKAIACSGMNPGLVQWMAMELLRREGGRVPDGCYIVERDTTFLADPEAVEPETVYTSWSPECFLEEAVEKVGENAGSDGLLMDRITRPL